VVILLFTGWLAGRLIKSHRVPLVTELPPAREKILDASGYQEAFPACGRGYINIST